MYRVIFLLIVCLFPLQTIWAQKKKPFTVIIYLENSPSQWIKIAKLNSKYTLLDSIVVNKGKDTLIINGTSVQEDLIQIQPEKAGFFPFIPVHGDTVKLWVDATVVSRGFYDMAAVRMENNGGAKAYYDLFLEYYDRFHVKSKALHTKRIEAESGSQANDSLANQYRQAIIKLKNEQVIWHKKQFYAAKYPHQAMACVLAIESALKMYYPIYISDEELKAMYHTFLQRFPKHNLANGIKTKLESKVIRKSSSFTDVEVEDMTSHNIKLSDFKGKYILLDFWASWCRPCREEQPFLIEAYETYKDHNFTIFSISLDSDRDKWLDAIYKDKVDKWTQTIDGEYPTASHIYNVYTLPTNYLISPDGKIIAFNLRGERLITKLKEILQTQESTE